MAKSSEVVARARSSAAPERVWSVLTDVSRWPAWSGFDAVAVEREGSPTPHGVGAIHRFTTRKIVTREETTAFVPPTRYGYTLLSGLPLRDYHAEVTLTPDGDGTAITWRSTFSPSFPGSGLFQRAFVRRIIRTMATALARESARAAG
jgi:hypothetical protein